MRVLKNLISCVDAVDQCQQLLSAWHHSDLTAVRGDISRNTAANRDSLNHRSLEDPREVIVRGIPLAVQHESLELCSKKSDCFPATDKEWPANISK